MRPREGAATSGMSLARKLAEHARRFASLPLIQAPPVMTDDDVDLWGNVLYARGLLEDLEKAIDQFIAEALAAADANEIVLFRTDVPDEAGLLLAAWREQVAAA